MHSAYLLLGSNLGNRFDLLNSARLLINDEVGQITACSLLYESAPWGDKSYYESEIVNDFLNQAIIISTELEPLSLIEILKKIERELGRIKAETDEESLSDSKKLWQNRTIDIDILFYDDAIVNTEELIIPHPYILDRKFVLLPLNEIAGEFIHPVMKKSVNELLKDSQDKGDVKVYKEKGC
jgi:2-amino-4-hydroxy-6-hydroxymethyldihydropteridine diphosphokinase